MDISNEIEFKNNNPGAVRFGNFINYYQFHSAENRIKLLPTNIWSTDENKYFGLDIGCNAGDITILLVDFFKKIHGEDIDCNFLGIDIDPTLILRAKEIETHRTSVQFECIDFMNDEQTAIIDKYLKNNNKSKFNVTFCLSITMWIHLNHGDEGLKNFLKKVCDYSDVIVIEPQPWKCYRTAVKRLKQANSEFPLFKQLVYRQNIEEYIENTIKECNFIQAYETAAADWERKILFYKRKE